MSGECEKCGEHATDCSCNANDEESKPYTIYRGVNGEVFLAFKNYDEYVEWSKRLK